MLRRKSYLRCSSASSVLWRSPTPPKRTYPDDGSFTFPDRSARADALEVSRFWCTLLADVHGLFDYAGSGGHSRSTRLADVAFPLTEKSRHPGICFPSSIILPASPLSTLRCSPSQDHRQDSRPEWSRFSFSVGLSHPLQCAGLSRRSLSRISDYRCSYRSGNNKRSLKLTRIR